MYMPVNWYLGIAWWCSTKVLRFITVHYTIFFRLSPSCCCQVKSSQVECDQIDNGRLGITAVYGGLTLPYLTFGVGRLLHLPSAEAVSVRPNAQPRCNPKVTVISCEAEKSPATWDWWRVVWLFLSCGLLLVSSSPSDYKSSGSSVHKRHHHDKVADHGVVYMGARLLANCGTELPLLTIACRSVDTQCPVLRTCCTSWSGSHGLWALHLRVVAVQKRDTTWT